MNRDNEAVQIVTDVTVPRRNFLRNSLLLAVPAMMGGTAFSAVAAVFSPPARTRGSSVVNVRDHGATGNGSTDDTAAFASAIKALPDAGGTVHVPDGDYLLDPTKNLRLRSRMHLQMASGTKLLAKPNSLTRAYVLDVAGAEDVEISGGQIVGERYQHNGTTGQWGHGIMVQGSTRVTVRDTRLSDCWGDGIQITSYRGTSSSDVVVANIVSTGNRRQGMSIGGSRNVKVYDCEFSDTNGLFPSCGIDIEPDRHTDDRAQDIHIENCLIRDNAGCGIQAYKRVNQVVIRRCMIIHNRGFGILTRDTTKGWIALNKIGHNRLKGLSLESGTADFKVSGNYFRNNITRNRGVQGADASWSWSGTSWTRLTGEVGGSNGTLSHVNVSDASNIRIATNFYD